MIQIDDYLLGESKPLHIGIDTENQTNLMLTTLTALNGNIRGRITSSADGSKIAEAVIKIRTQPGDPVAHTKSNSGGNYDISDIAPGTYTVNATYTGYLTSPGQTITIQGGQTFNLDITLSPDLRPQNSIFGIVSDMVTGTPLCDAFVALIPANFDIYSTMSMSTNNSGQYLIDEIPDGDYLIGASYNHYHPTNFIPVSVSGGKFVPVNISLQAVSVPLATVSGYIKNSNGTPISNACVGLHLVDSNGSETLRQVTFTTADGFYFFSRVSEGTYIVKSKLEKTISS